MPHVWLACIPQTENTQPDLLLIKNLTLTVTVTDSKYKTANKVSLFMRLNTHQNSDLAVACTSVLVTAEGKVNWKD